MSAAVAAALAGTAGIAAAVPGVLFDPSGGGGAGTAVTQFNWNQISVIVQNGFVNATGAGSVTGAIVAGQGRLNDLVGIGLNGNFTFVFSMDNVTVTKSGNAAGATATADTPFGTAPGSTPTATNFFTIYANTVTNTQLGGGTGCFSCGTPILSGSVYVDNSLSATGPGDIAGGTVLSAREVGTGTASIGGAGITTLSGSQVVTRTFQEASSSVGLVINVDTTSVNTNYFRSDISSLDLDLTFGASLLAPFTTVFLQKTVAGLTPNLGALVGGSFLNDFVCNGAPGGTGVGTTPCDLILSAITGASTVKTSFAPEPGSLALLGLGLTALGGYLRRRKRSET